MRNLLCADVLAGLVAAIPVDAKAGNQVSCESLVSLSKGIGPILETVSHMLEWCIDRGGRDQSCKELIRVSKENNLGHHAQKVSLKAISLGLQCPADD